jgi:F-type H+-transporting ATPase subunit b
MILRALFLALALLLSAAPVAHVAAEDEKAAHASEHEHAGPMHLGDVFRAENTSFWGAVINFSLLVFLLRRFGKKPLREFLTSRRREMEQAIAEATAAKQKADARFNEYTERLKTLDHELDKLRADIERSAAEDKQRIMAEAQETTRRLRRDTESLIEQHARTLTATVRDEMVEAAVAAAETLLRQALTEADQQRLAQGFNQEVKATRGAASGPKSHRAGGQL